VETLGSVVAGILSRQPVSKSTNDIQIQGNLRTERLYLGRHFSYFQPAIIIIVKVGDIQIGKSTST